jgi:ADP-ribosylglycohydrolase
VAVARAVLDGLDYGDTLRRLGNYYTGRGYGASFHQWLANAHSGPYNSWGNGSAMRVSPIGYAFESVEQVLSEAERTAEVTHNHPEGIKGAQAVVLAVFLVRKQISKQDLGSEISRRFGYDLNRTVAEIRPGNSYEISCQR